MPHQSFPSSADACRNVSGQNFPPCRSGSPLGINYGVLAVLTASGREKEAGEALRRVTPFGGILSALGDPFAEALCPKKNDLPFLPRMLRLLETAYPEIVYRPLEETAASGKHAVIIGSGPAGLQAAWTLREHGHAVTVLEAAPSPGITLLHAPVAVSRWAPAAPTPPGPAEVMEKTIAMLAESGIIFRCSSPVGQSELDDLCRNYDTVICACGKGAVLPTNAEGNVKENLFAAGTCVKNQKGLGALQSMAFAEKSALAACRMLDENLPRPEKDTSISFPLSEKTAVRDEMPSAAGAEVGTVYHDALRCLDCLKR